MSGNHILTDEGRMSALAQLRGSSQDKLELSLPTLELYNLLGNDQGLQKAALEMLRTIGKKPARLATTYADKVPGFVDVSDHQIRIDNRFRDHPAAAGNLLARGIIMHLCGNRSDLQHDPAFIEFATIHSGLGLWIINGLPPAQSLEESLYNALDGAWHKREGLRLTHYHAKNYAALTIQYAHSTRTSHEAIMAHIFKNVQGYIPEIVRHTSSRCLPTPTITNRHLEKNRALGLRVLLVALIIGVAGIVTSMAIVGSDSSEEQARLSLSKRITEKRTALVTCGDELSTQQSKADPNDLFAARQTELIQSRCLSLQNEYESALQEYRKLYLD